MSQVVPTSDPIERDDLEADDTLFWREAVSFQFIKSRPFSALILQATDPGSGRASSCNDQPSARELSAV